MPAVINRISVRDGDPTGGLEFRVIFTESVDLSTIGPEDFIVTGGSSATVTNIKTIGTETSRIDVQVSGDGLNAFTGDVGIALSPSATITTTSDGQNINVSEAPRENNVVSLVGDGSEPPVEEPPVEEPPVEEPPVEEVESTGNTSDSLLLDKVNRLGDEETSDDVLKFRAVFNEEAQNVSPEDWVVTGGSTATVTDIFVVNDGGNKLYDVTVSGGDLADFNGTVGIALSDSQNIVDADRDELPTAAPAVKNLTYTVTNEVVTTPTTGTPTTGTPTTGTPTTPTTGTPTPTTGLESLLTPLTGADVLEITELGNAKALSLKIDTSSIFSVGDVKVFSTDAAGNNRTQVGGFSVLEDTLSAVGFSPTFNLTGASIASGTFLQFEIVEKGITDVATLTTLTNGEIALDFGNGTQLLTGLVDEAPAPDLTLDDAAAIDLTGLTGELAATFTVHREAALTNTVGFYTTDTADGGIVDALTGNTIRPGDVGYKAAALANQLDVQLSGENGQVKTFDASINSGVFLGTFVVIDGVDPAVGEVFFSHQGANSDGIDHIRQVGDNAFGIEDQSGGGDLDFNDMVVSFKIEAAVV